MNLGLTHLYKKKGRETCLNKNGVNTLTCTKEEEKKSMTINKIGINTLEEEKKRSGNEGKRK